MTVPLDRLPAAVVACPVRAAAAVIRLVVGREAWESALAWREDPVGVMEAELAAWEREGMV
jgi:hypothetical protein